MAGSLMTDGVATWTETWEAGNIHLLWPSVPPSLLNHYSGSFSTLTSGAADVCVWRSTSMVRTLVGKSEKEGEGSRDC